MSSQSSGSGADPIWTAFQSRHQDNLFLGEDPLYSMTPDVIAAITEEVPDFFTPEQKEFEADLARWTGGGFFLKRSIGVPAFRWALPNLTIEDYLRLGEPSRFAAPNTTKQLAPPVNPLWFNGSNQQMIRSLEEIMVDLWEANGYSKKDIRDVQRQTENERSVRAQREEAYAGWLILNDGYRSELKTLRAAWKATIARQGGFPTNTPQEYLPGAEVRPTRRDTCAKACFAFYRRWGLDRLLTWDLPVPCGPGLHWGEYDGSSPRSEEGITLSIPWYMLRGGKFDLQAIAQRIRFESTPEHLREWVCRPAGRRDATGEITFQHLYGLYRCYELVLFRRYRSACENNIEKLDRAMGTIMGREEDLVKRLRQRLAREFRALC